MTSPRKTSSRMPCRIEGPGESRALEFETFVFPLVGTATTDLPAPPGAVQHDAAGRLTLLHFAPGRFLAPAPPPDIVRHLDALAAAGVGAVFDVEGKWRALAVLGAGAERVLAETIDVASVLSHRECAAVRLFDCPVVLARAPEGFSLWVEASYATDLREMLDRVHAQ
jgi:hypothetical protein